MNLFLLNIIFFYFIRNRFRNICLIIYYDIGFCYLYIFHSNTNLNKITLYHCSLILKICQSNKLFKVYTYDPCGSVTLLFNIANLYKINYNNICIKKLSDLKIFDNLIYVIDVKSIYNFCYDYLAKIINKYEILNNFCCSICSSRILLCLFKINTVLVFCNVFKNAINYFILKFQDIFQSFKLYNYHYLLFINNQIINYINIPVKNIYILIFKLFFNKNILNNFFSISYLIENFIIKLINKFIGINKLSLMISKKLFNLKNEIIFELDNIYSLNYGVRMKKNSNKYTYHNVLKIDFISFYSSIYLCQYYNIFQQSLSSILFFEYILTIYNKKFVTNEKIYKNLLNFFYGYLWSNDSFGEIICYIGEVIMTSFIHFLHNNNVKIIDCNIDHIVISCINKNINSINDLCNKFLNFNNLNNWFKLNIVFAQKAFILDCNNSIMYINNNIIGRGIFNFDKYLSLLNENTFNNILKCYYCLDINLNKFNYLACIYFIFIEDDLCLKYFDKSRVIKIAQYFYTNLILENLINNIDYDFCVRLISNFYNSFDLKILISICKYFTYNLLIFCFPVIFKMQPSSKINKIMNFIRLSNICLKYWIYLCSEYIKLNFGTNICLAIYCKNMLCLDFDHYQFYNLTNILNRNFLCITSPRIGAKIVGISKYNYKSNHDNLECINNKWISIYGNYILNNYNGKYCFYLKTNKLFNFDNINIDLFQNFFKKINYFNDKVILKNKYKHKLIYKDFKNLFKYLLEKELYQIKSKIHSIILIFENDVYTHIKFNIICSGHRNKNYQAFCFLKFDSLCGVILNSFNFIIACSGKNCRINYVIIKNNIIRLLKD
ncbi:hypothetical protein IOLA_003 [uncultured bacterium]|nr:hypothetical protein IOLA_003 [uncultured bacterium]